MPPVLYRRGEVTLFKSVFTKYITAFMVILLVSFTVLILIVSAIVTNFSINTKHDLMEQTARNIIININNMLQFTDDFETLVEDYSHRISRDLNIQAQNSNSVILITDKNGEILFMSTEGRDQRHDLVLSDVPAEIVRNVASGIENYSYSTLGGVFNDRHMNYITFVTANDNYKNSVAAENEIISMDDIECVIFICTSSMQVSGLVENVTRTTVILALWIFLVALIAIYLISEKITEPLKSMSKAAKSFAQGKFDVRVKVTGHDEVAQLALAFNNMATSLAKNEDLRKSFLANVSHDLRTPMTTIAGFVDGILDGTIPAEQQEHYLGIISSEVRRLSRLVASLLDISRMQAGDRKFNKTAFDICEMSRQILIAQEKRIDQKKLEVEFDCSKDKMFVYADVDAMHQVLYNLCDNAIKFANEGGYLKIGIAEKDKKIKVSVKNSGNGIPSEDLPFVFDRFYKSDRSRGLDKTGVGLGLYIVKTIIDQHNEEIKVSSEYGEYCEFVFTLAKIIEPPKIVEAEECKE